MDDECYFGGEGGMSCSADGNMRLASCDAGTMISSGTGMRQAIQNWVLDNSFHQSRPARKAVALCA